MSVDSRSTHTDALATLGTIIGEGEKRDAIHLGVEPVIAGTTLFAGEHVYLKNGKAYSTSYTNKTTKPVGIVDPFLLKEVRPGQRFWLIVYPRQITSLRHVWEHPDFPDSRETGSQSKTVPTEEQLHKTMLLLRDEKALAREEIAQFAKSIDMDFHELMAAAKDYQEHGEYLHEGDRFEGVSIPDRFWEHYATYTGEEVRDPYNFFSCSC